MTSAPAPARLAAAGTVRDPVAWGAVFVGGALGAAARAALPATGLGHGIPWGMFAVNAAGAFLLGFLTNWLAPARPGRPRATARRARLKALLGTGAMGGFTTYSSFAVCLAALTLGAGTGGPRLGVATGGPNAWPALAYGLGALLVGIAAAAAGAALRTPVTRGLWWQPSVPDQVEVERVLAADAGAPPFAVTSPDASQSPSAGNTANAGASPNLGHPTEASGSPFADGTADAGGSPFTDRTSDAGASPSAGPGTGPGPVPRSDAAPGSGADR
ncbi:MAG: CrcB family protein [Bifidobacteriaceae bacterium]|nr:CrcB family protein [Bifidobacteriaceae bacterium]